MSKPEKLYPPNPLVECCTIGEVYLQFEGHWLCIPMMVLQEELQDWWETKYLTDRKPELERFSAWMKLATQTAYEWHKPEFIAELKEILKTELPGWTEAYKFYGRKEVSEM